MFNINKTFFLPQNNDNNRDDIFLQIEARISYNSR